jgi:hypothetical protein
MEEERFLVLWFREEIRTTARDERGKMDFCPQKKEMRPKCKTVVGSMLLLS